MSDVEAITHKDKTLNVLRWLAFGAVGVYLWRVNKLEGKAIGSENPKNFQLGIDMKQAVNAAFEVIPPLQKLNPMIKTGIKEFINGYKKERDL